ncbi:hypothetical protein [Streptomyces blastmyceticus]|uniref:SH3 domain-containing protein n=1 Tax=Streptomyces blastmyceticus TaxID=68180 RepID=A0ABP3FYI9_9ACTN
MLRRQLASLAVVVLSVSGAFVGASTANAADPVDSTKISVDCDHSITHHTPGSSWGFMKGTYNLKAGPYAACDTWRSVSYGTEIWIWCHTYNVYNHLWVYGRVAGTNDTGWMSGDNLDWRGGSDDC